MTAMSAMRRPKPPAAPADSETRVREDHHDSLRLWLRLLSCSTLIENHIRQRLQAEFATTLPRFDLMAQLERCPEGLKMGELSQRLMVTGGNVTGITDLLEKDGLVARVTDASGSARRDEVTRVEPDDRRDVLHQLHRFEQERAGAVFLHDTAVHCGPHGQRWTNAADLVRGHQPGTDRG